MNKWERRSYFRVKEKLFLSLSLRDRATRKRVFFKGEAFDIGVAGLSILTEQILPNVDQGLIEITLPSPFQPLKARVKIKWRQDEKQFYGIGFTNSPENNFSEWEKFVKGSSSTLPDRRHMEQGRRSNSGATSCPSSNQEKRKTLRRIEDLWTEGESDLKQGKRSSISRADLIPNFKGIDYTHRAAESRREWLSLKTGASLKHVGVFSESPENMKGNIENFIGVAQVPIGVAGPLKINGEFAKGDFYIPMATTEGVLIYTYNQGMQLISLAGGAIATLLKDETHISPIFVFDSVKESQVFIQWLENNFVRIKECAERTTNHGKLVKIEPYIFDRNVVIKFCYTTGDAMGQNMVTFATEEACKYIVSSVKIKKIYIQSNFSSNKKVTMHHFVTGYGKTVIAEIVVPAALIKRVFGITPEQIVEFYRLVKLTTTHAGMIGINGHTANALAAIFIACGQDAASVVDSYVGVTNFEVMDDRSLYASLKLPSLVIGTVGGGTDLATQRECLNLLGCYGAEGSRKFSEIIVAAALAGEIAICAKVANGTFADGHRKHGRKSQNSLLMATTL